jgi:hypothetical protein
MNVIYFNFFPNVLVNRASASELSHLSNRTSIKLYSFGYLLAFDKAVSNCFSVSTI